MRELIENFGEQLKHAIEIGNSISVKAPKKEIKNVVITGLGGSGIGGTIVSELLFDKCKVPVFVNKDYFLPAYINENTLVIASSFSGNTEETLQAAEIAKSKGCSIACITSGGKLEEFATANQYTLVKLPGGFSPRAFLSYSLTQLIFLFEKFDLAAINSSELLLQTQLFLNQEKESIKEIAQKFAKFFHGKTPVLYTTALNEGIIIRLRQQINENSKQLCWHHVIPEMNHNELVGWTKPNDNLAVLFYIDNDEYFRTKFRIDICKEIISKYTNNIMYFEAKGNNKIEKAYYTINLGDWISWYLSELNHVDAVEVNVINYLKGSLSKI